MLVYQLNHINIDLFNILISNWLAWIQLFNFEVRHILKKYHVLPNALSRRPLTKTNSTNNENINKFIKQALVIQHEVYPVGITDPAKAGRQNEVINKNIKTPKGSLKQAPLKVNNLLDEKPGPVTLNPDS